MINNVSIDIVNKFRDAASPLMIGEAMIRAGELANEIVRASAGQNIRSTTYWSNVLNCLCDERNCFSRRFVKACQAASRLEIVLTREGQVYPFRINVALLLPKRGHTVRLACLLTSNGSIHLYGSPQYEQPF